jgi:hypothetical protein
MNIVPRLQRTMEIIAQTNATSLHTTHFQKTNLSLFAAYCLKPIRIQGHYFIWPISFATFCRLAYRTVTAWYSAHTRGKNTAVIDKKGRIILLPYASSVGLMGGSAAVRFLGLRVRILPAAWMSVSCECRVLSGRGLCVGLITSPEESYQLWCVWVWSWSLEKKKRSVTTQECNTTGSRRRKIRYKLHKINSLFSSLWPARYLI